MAALLLLLLAAEPGWKEILDPFDPAFGDAPERWDRKRGAFEARIAKSGPSDLGKLAQELVHADETYALLDARTAKADEIHLAARAKWTDWRDAYVREYRKTHAMDPSGVPIPPPLHRAYLDAEQAWKTEGAFKRAEVMFQDWARTKAAAAIRALDAPQRAKALGPALAGLRSSKRRLAAAELLGAADPALLAPALAAEKDAGVAAFLLDCGAGDPAGYLDHADWRVRAAAIRRLGAAGRRDLLEARRAKEDGRLLDDLDAALGSPPPPRGLATRSKRVVFCVDATPRMGGQHRALASAVDALPEDALFAAIAFQDRAVASSRTLVPAGAAAKAAARAFLEKLEPSGEANLFDALQSALAMDPDTVIVVTGGEAVIGLYMDSIQLGQEVRLANRLVGAAVHVCGPAYAEPLLKWVAEGGRGAFTPLGGG